jgi:hypothetical protein
VLTCYPTKKKLRKYGILGKTYDWFASYLKNRKQQVDIDGHLSATSILNITVIQGSIFGLDSFSYLYQ